MEWECGLSQTSSYGRFHRPMLTRPDRVRASRSPDMQASPDQGGGQGNYWDRHAPVAASSPDEPEDASLDTEPLVAEITPDAEQPQKSLEVVDDSVRAYLAEIGTTPLLTMEQERELGRQKDARAFLRDLERECSQSLPRPVRATDVVVALLDRMQADLPLLQAVEGQLGMETSATLGARLSYQGLWSFLEEQPGAETLQAIAGQLGRSRNDVEQSWRDLFYTIDLLPPRVISLLEECPPWGLEEFVEDPGFYRRLEAQEKWFERYFRQVEEKGDQAEDRLVKSNLRLVVSVAKKHVNRGVPFLDLIQEGNLGLLRAVERFDYRRGYKFSTYATWWVRQGISRAIADQSRTIRVPVHMSESLNKLDQARRRLVQELGREPSVHEISKRMNLPRQKVEEMLRLSQYTIPLEMPVADEEHSLLDFLEDRHVPSPEATASDQLLREQLAEALSRLDPREQRVVRLRFGLEDGRTLTLEEVGREFGVTRERVRQIEKEAVRKLRHPSISRKLKDYLE